MLSVLSIVATDGVVSLTFTASSLGLRASRSRKSSLIIKQGNLLLPISRLSGAGNCWLRFSFCSNIHNKIKINVMCKILLIKIFITIYWKTLIFTIHLVIAGKPSSVISIFTWCEGFPWNISFYHDLFPKILLHQLIKKYIYLAALTFLLQLQDAQYRKSAITLSIICRSLNDT